MKKEMLINVLQPEECRIAIVEDGVLEELYVERASQESYVNNIYKGRIVNIEPSIQAAFVDFGIGRNGFLHVSDVDPVYYKHLIDKQRGDREDRRDKRDRPRKEQERNRDSDRNRDRNRRPFEPVVIPSGMVDAVPPEFQDEVPVPVSEEAIPSDPGFDVMEAELEHDGFGAGLDLEDTITRPPLPVTPPPLPVTPPPLPQEVAQQPIEEEEDPGAEEFRRRLMEARKIHTPKISLEEDLAPREQSTPIDSSVTSLRDLLTEPSQLEEPRTELEEPKLDSIVEEPTTETVAEEIPTEPQAEEPTTEPKKRRTSRKKATPADSEEPKPKKRRTSRKKEVVETPSEETPTETPESEAPSEETNPDDDKPKYMSSAERRTHGDEAEISGSTPPDGHFVFDPYAPNDRFSGGDSSADIAAPVQPFLEDAPSLNEENAIHAVDATVVEDSIPDDNFDSDTALFDEEDSDEDEEDFDFDEEDFGASRSRGRGGRDRGGRDRGRGGRDRGGRNQRRSFGRDGKDAIPKPPIQEIFKRGQEVIVQVIKEGIGTKGPTLSTYISIAGRYLVLMPSLNRLAVSRKIMDESVRGRLKDALSGLEPPKGVGFIIRTAAIDRNKEELQKDLAYLVRLWEVFVRRVRKMAAPVEIYRESDMITRTIRDNFTSDIDTIYVDEETSFTQAQEFLNIVMPRYASRIKHYADTEPLFHRFRIEEEISRIQEKKVPLPMGGSIVIEQTEALVAIDVNSGNFRADNNAEETAYQMNLQAAKEIGRQLRLRDLGGVIVNDFIDMKEERHRRGVENALRDALRRDRARTKILRTSAFGVIEMTRQRIRPSLKRSVYQECTHCRGTSFVKTSESMSIEIMRVFQLAAHKQVIRKLDARVHVDVAHYLLNKKRRELSHWEELGRMQVTITGVMGVSPEFLEIQCFDNNGSEIRFYPAEPTPRMLPSRSPGHRDHGRGDRDRDRDHNRDRDRDRDRRRERDYD